jgi:hypothetical protein
MIEHLRDRGALAIATGSHARLIELAMGQRRLRVHDPRSKNI